jgi:hypothetical protein
MDSVRILNNLIYFNKNIGLRITRYDLPPGTYLLKNVSILNNTIYGNGTLGSGWDPDNSGINIFNVTPEHMLINNNILSNNAYCTIYVEEDVPDDSVNINFNLFDGFRNYMNENSGTNAIFASALFIDSLNNNYHLQPTSPAVDGGDTDLQFNDPEDGSKPGFALYPSLGTTRNDIGAYGGPYALSWDPKSYTVMPLKPLQVFPANGATSVPTTLLIGWNGSRGATSYRLQVSTAADFSSLVLDSSNLIGSSFGVRDLDENTQYYWRVSATNAAGTGDFSNPWNFTTKGPTWSEQPGSNMPTGYALYQNFPNPFNGATVIWYAIPEYNNVIVEVFDLSGKKIETLVDEDLPPGYHKTVFESKTYRDGVYLCRISAGNYQQVMKMVLAR